MAEERDDKFSQLQSLCGVLAWVSMAAGAAGLVLSFFTARACGFIGGSILIGAGLISLTLLSRKPG